MLHEIKFAVNAAPNFEHDSIELGIEVNGKPTVFHLPPQLACDLAIALAEAAKDVAAEMRRKFNETASASDRAAMVRGNPEIQ